MLPLTSSTSPQTDLPFEAAGGSVPGRTHVAAGRNNQDAFAWSAGPGTWVGVVCDGCSTSQHGEVGALLAARWVSRSLSRRLARGDASDALEVVTLTLRASAANVWRLARSLDDELSRTVLDYFLFTVVAALVTRNRVRVFAVGDGVVAVNGKVMRLGPFPENAPPYLGYSVLSEAMGPGSGAVLCHDGPSDSLQSMLIGTDGVADLASLEARRIPGREEAVGPLSQFWTDDKHFANPDSVRRRLTLFARERVRVNPSTGVLVRETGLLPDDTTLIALRRRVP